MPTDKAPSQIRICASRVSVGRHRHHYRRLGHLQPDIVIGHQSAHGRRKAHDLRAPAQTTDGFVASQAVAALHGQRDIQKVVLVGPATSRFGVAAIPGELRQRTLVIHGEHDDTVPLQSVMDWARPQALPVLVVPGGGHFFHGQLPLLRELVQRHLVA